MSRASGTIEDRQGQLGALYARLFPATQNGATANGTNGHDADSPALSDMQVIAKALGAKNADKVGRLLAGDMSGYKSRSEADAGLLGCLSFYTRDRAQLG